MIICKSLLNSHREEVPLPDAILPLLEDHHHLLSPGDSGVSVPHLVTVVHFEVSRLHEDVLTFTLCWGGGGGREF